MSKRILDALPPELCELLDGEDLEAKVGETFSLLTVDEDGWPNVALLSVGEVLARSPIEVGLALWSGTATTRSVERDGRATLSCVVGPTAYNVRLDARPRASEERLTFFDCDVRAVEADVVDYAVLESGLRFRLVDPAAAVERWRRTVEAIRRRA